MNRKLNHYPKRISDAVIRRLSLYYRTLDILERSGIEAVSSQKLGEIEGIPDFRIRKDLSYFGSFGERGVGYNVSSLKKHITKILGLDRKWNIVLIGGVSFGAVLLNSEILRKKNLCITKIFDRTPEFVGKKINNIPVWDIDNLEKEIDPHTDDLAIIAVPPPEVQSVVDRLGKIGLRGILYFASRAISAPENTVIRNQDISVELGTITYHIINLIRARKETCRSPSTASKVTKRSGKS